MRGQKQVSELMTHVRRVGRDIGLLQPVLPVWVVGRRFRWVRFGKFRTSSELPSPYYANMHTKGEVLYRPQDRANRNGNN